MPPKPLFCDGVFSQIGRKTQEHLNALRTQLGVDCDPAYDYTEILERQKELAKKKAKASDEEPPVEPSGPMAELQKALQAAEAQQEKVDEDAKRPVTPPLIRHRRKVKNDWPFTVQSRDDMHKRLLSGFKNPEPGHYRPRDVFPEHRPVTKPLSMVAKVFPEHTSESILTTKRREEYSQLEKPDPDFWKKPAVSIELSEDYLFSTYGPEKPGYKVKTSSLGKQMPRPSMAARGGRIDPPEGIENIDETQILSTAPRQPEWDFAKWLPRASPAMQPFHCGQYKPNYNMIAPRSDLVGMAFEKQMKRPNPEEGFGRNKPAKPGSEGKSVKVDRSLFRAQPGIVSTIPRVPDVNLSNQTGRPGMAKIVCHYDKSDPKIVEQVRKNEMEINWHDTFKATAPNNMHAPDLSRQLRREQAIVGLRVFGADPALMRLRYPKEPTATEQLPVEAVDSQCCRPRVLIKDFKKMASRYPTKIHMEHAARYQEPAPDKFVRPLLETESHPNLSTLSSATMRVAEMRQSRSFEALPDWDEFCNSTI